MIKTSDLYGDALDYSVARAEELVPYIHYVSGTRHIGVLAGIIEDYRPSARWKDGGPIIERERLIVQPFAYIEDWQSFYEFSGGPYGEGRTPLIAAMRAYIASKIGDEIDVPDELVNDSTEEEG